MRFKIKLVPWLSTIFLLVFCFPRNAAALGKLILIQNNLEVLGVIWTVYIIICYRNILVKKLWPMYLLLIWIYPCTIFNNGNFIKIMEVTIRLCCIVVLSELLIKNNCKKYICNIAAYWTVLMCIELFSCLTNCFGSIIIENNRGQSELLYLFGMKVEINQYVIYAVAFNMIAVLIGGLREKIMLIIIVLAALIFSLKTSASTSLVGMTIMFIFLAAGRFSQNKRIWEKLVILIVVYACLFGFSGNTSMFAWLVDGILQEGVTLNGRTVLWSETLKLMKGYHLLLGYGMTPAYIIKLNAFFSVDHPHNQYLQCLFNFGILGLILYLYIWLCQIKAIKIINNKRLRNVYIAALVSNMIICIVSRNLLYGTAQIFFVISMHMSEITEMCNNRTIVKPK